MKFAKFVSQLKEKGYTPAILLVISLIITAAITIYFSLTVRELLQTQFDRRSASIVRSLNTSVQSYSFLLKGIQSLMESDQNFSEDEFTSYVERFVNPSVYPGIVATGFTGDRTYALLYENNPPGGLLNNMFAQNKARDTGTFSTSIYRNIFIVIYLPVYSNTPADTLESRRQFIQGYAFVAINSQEFLKTITSIQPNIGFKLNSDPFFSSEIESRELSFLTIRKDVSYQFFDESWPIILSLYPNKELSDHILFLCIIAAFGIGCSFTVYQVSLRQYRSQKKADNLERQKDEFVAIASHELKTPLTSIKALNQILAEKLSVENNPLYESFFRKTDSQIKRMELLIKDLMDVSKIRANKLDYNKDWFDLEMTTKIICEELQETRKSHQIVVNGHLFQQLYGDKNRISQVVTNLLTNAIKYSPQANLIIVTMKETVKESIISIQDFGIGISNDSQKKIFERFYRIHQDERKYQGMGIGLFISAEIVHKHGGKIWVKSTKGKGSTFYFSLPLKPIEE